MIPSHHQPDGLCKNHHTEPWDPGRAEHQRSQRALPNEFQLRIIALLKAQAPAYLADEGWWRQGWNMSFLGIGWGYVRDTLW